MNERLIITYQLEIEVPEEIANQVKSFYENRKDGESIYGCLQKAENILEPYIDYENIEIEDIEWNC